MKLYNLDHSPYATRVRMLVRKKQLAVDFVRPEEALRTPEFVEQFPMGKIPVLELDDGSQLPDSWVIMEYLDELGEDRLSPQEALPRAHMQLLARYADTYLSPAALFPLFQRVAQPQGAEAELAAMEAELSRLERLLQMLPEFEEREVNLGDMALATAMDYLLLLCPLFGLDEPLAAYPLVAQWNNWVHQDDAVAQSSAEMLAAARALYFPG